MTAVLAAFGLSTAGSQGQWVAGISTITVHRGFAMQAKPGSFRDVMPETAGIVDWLRAQLGQERADKVIKAGMKGHGTFWTQERGPDGVVREFGSRNTSTRWPTEEAKQ